MHQMRSSASRHGSAEFSKRMLDGPGYPNFGIRQGPIEIKADHAHGIIAASIIARRHNTHIDAECLRRVAHSESLYPTDVRRAGVRPPGMSRSLQVYRILLASCFASSRQWLMNSCARGLMVR